MTLAQQFPRLISTSPEVNEQSDGKNVSQKSLLNKLNFINFQDGTLQIIYKHSRYDRTISISAKPQPCTSSILDCNLTDSEITPQQLQAYKFQHLLIADERKFYIVKAEIAAISETGIRLILPETCREFSFRRACRYQCDGVDVQLIQNSALFKGVLVDFNAFSLRIKVTAAPPQTFQWIRVESPVNIVISVAGEVLYSGECRLLKQSLDQQIKTYVLEPLHQHVRRFKPKEIRSLRQILVPSPNVVFLHPFIGKKFDLKAIDLSTSGFSVEEDEENSVLLPGMIIPELSLNFAGNFSFSCKAQVVYRNSYSNKRDEHRVKSGFAILDMDMHDHVRMLALLNQAKDKSSYVCNTVDMDNLWDFFFEAGFIYPQKYAYIEANKEQLKATYEKLYTQHPNIARHFIYQENGKIYGHCSTLRFYENTWISHHHAATRSSSHRAGLVVLNQLSRYINDANTIFSAHMNYIVGYFRPDNKFPRKVFGGCAEAINDSRKCSVDGFAYFHYQRTYDMEWNISGPWGLNRSSPEDLVELEAFYTHRSGGLMLHALDLEPSMMDSSSLDTEYRRLGFKRERHLYSVTYDGILKAIIMVVISDVGLNLSDLTNCIKVFVVDEENFPREMFNLMLSCLTLKFNKDDVPVLVYPTTYAELNGIPYDKIYNMWVLNLLYSDEYMKFMEKILKTDKYGL
ncbi:MAG: PilZ domain-containing protein [Geobacter sp.]|nr:MAG: PilZ domain-containing protein [Geobacter sp.]